MGLENWAGRRIIFGRAVVSDALGALVSVGIFFAVTDEFTYSYLYKRMKQGVAKEVTILS